MGRTTVMRTSLVALLAFTLLAGVPAAFVAALVGAFVGALL